MLRKVLFVLAFAIVAAGLYAAEYKGKIKSVDADGDKITITVEDKDVTLSVDKEVKVVGGKDGTTALKGGLKAKALKANANVTVTTEGSGDKEVVKEIKVGGKKQ